MTMTNDSVQQTGWHTGYTDDIANEICERLVKKQSLLLICSDPAMPSTSMVYRWLEEYESFRDKYARARKIQADLFAAETIDISDREMTDAVDVAKARLQYDARRWYASKIDAKKYGDKIQQEHTGPDGGAIEISAKTKLISEIMLLVAPEAKKE